jgi:hypothetical protein
VLVVVWAFMAKVAMAQEAQDQQTTVLVALVVLEEAMLLEQVPRHQEISIALLVYLQLQETLVAVEQVRTLQRLSNPMVQAEQLELFGGQEEPSQIQIHKIYNLGE